MANSDAEPTDILKIREHVRHALEHLYDADILAEHWLIHPLGLAQEPVRSRALRQCLMDAIQRMAPPPTETPDSLRWQMYQVLIQRYVQRTTASALADQLDMSSRNLRRLQSRAIAQLTENLMQQMPAARPLSERDTKPAAELQDAKRIEAVDDEISWLHNVALSEPIHLPALVHEALEIVRRANTDVYIRNRIPSDLPQVAIHPTGLRQVLLSVLNSAVQYTKKGSVTLAASTCSDEVVLTVTAVPVESTTLEQLPKLTLAQRILKIFGGQITKKVGPKGELEITASLLAAGRTNILVIDDNPDALQLYERYTIGTRYHLISCTEPRRTLEMAIKYMPRIIILDIMMPDLDGWSLLAQLRHHPVTASIPVIVCSIISERNLTFSLGAADFMQKPITRTAFLSVLARQLTAAAPESR